MTRVYFATNRQPDAAKEGGYGAEIAAMKPDAIIYDAIDVTGVNLDDAASGQLGKGLAPTPGEFARPLAEEIVANGNNLLVFIHGFANAFADAIKRAAFNAEWFRASRVDAANTTIVAFTWPSLGALVAVPPHFLDDDYKADQTQAGKSAFHIGYFLNYIDNLRLDYRQNNPTGRIFLLAHSMGNYALAGAIEWWFANRGSADLMFDEVFLAAADEVDDTFDQPMGGRLHNLPKLGRRISIYSSRKDVAMYLSAAVNLDTRLGFDGPDHKHDATLYPAATFRIVDVTEVDDFNPLNPPDATHQYYRRSQIVRADITKTMANDPSVAGGLFSLSGESPSDPIAAHWLSLPGESPSVPIKTPRPPWER
jgi:esterase/lipase superfamily enzyme